MSFLRRRFRGDDTPVESREPSPTPGQPRPTNLRVITAEQLHTLKQKGKSKRKNAWIFGLGGVFGLLLAGFFASSNEMIDLKGLENMNLDSILDALPANFVSSAQQLQVRRPSPSLPSHPPPRPAQDGADRPRPVEARARCRQLRLLRRRAARA